MAKYDKGTICVVFGMKPMSTEKSKLLKYEGEQVEIQKFEGNVVIGDRFFNEGDWYRVRAADGSSFYAREYLLHKRPDQWAVLGTWERIKEDIGWTHKEES